MAAEVDERMQLEDDVLPALADLASDALWLGVVAFFLPEIGSTHMFDWKCARKLLLECFLPP